MYTVSIKVRGDAPLMQHRFPLPDLSEVSKGATRKSGSKDYTQEWREYLYVDSKNMIFQPSSHFEGAMVKAATSFKITGRGNKTYKDLIQANVVVTPEQIPFNVKNPESLDTDADKKLYLDVRPVTVNRARVPRMRPTFKAGWELEFDIEVFDDQIQPSLLQDILVLAGKTCAVGDYRPKFGRFSVVRFEVNK